MTNLSKGAFLLVTFVLALFAGAKTNAQSALDGFDPNTNGYVWVVVVQPDGKILIGGNFTIVSPNDGPAVPRNRIARLNPDGSLDTTFNPNVTDTNPNTIINAIAVQADGQIIVGGYFSNIGGQMRNNIARLDATTGLADSFNPNANERVYAVAVQADGKILAGGGFSNIGGQARNHIARLDGNTGLADSFNPNANGFVFTIAVQADGKILAGGAFNAALGNPSIGGQLRNGMARLDPDTGLADLFNPDANGAVLTIAMQADGKIVVGGTFEVAISNPSIGGQARNGIARLDPTTGLADSFDPNASDWVLSIAAQADGKILAAGKFLTIGGQTRHFIARLDPTAGLADPFNPNANSEVRSITHASGGKILAGGGFTALAPNGGAAITRNSIARLEQDGRVDQTLDIHPVGSYMVATAIQPDGKMVIGGFFSSILGVPRSNIARLNSDGSLDMSFNPNATGEIFQLALQPDGKILVGGRITNIGGQRRSRIARIDGTTGLADSFDPNASADVISMSIQADGKILVGGGFTTIGGQTRRYLARLDGTTGLADSFNPNPNSAVESIAIQPDGKILVGGFFHGANSIGAQTRNYIARLDPATGLADSFDPNANNAIFKIALQADGKVLTTGSFSGANSIGGQTRRYLARLDPVTGLADSFDPRPDDWILGFALQSDGKIVTNGYFSNIGGQPRNRIARLDPVTGLPDTFNPTAKNLVLSTVVMTDGKILACGNFPQIGGEPRNLLARLTNDTPAIQELDATSNMITWSRGGASPLLSSVTFEYSTDNANYTSLGEGTSNGSNWILSGLDLPNAQNFYIRARGFYGAEEYTNSGSITESVRLVFLHEVSLANVVSRKVHGAAGAFDINLPRSGNPGIECRSGGATGDYQLVFSFANPIISVGGASITSGIGNIASRMIDTDAHNYIVNLTGVTNEQTINVNLTNVNDNAGNSSSSISAPMAILIGDVNGNGSVNASDISQTKSNSGQTISGTNFRSDANANGSINASDVALVKSNSGTAL